tara:strand:+ start:1076 stop:1609 length:534 start_codon:yes stop_codon:yes gene_type:complete
MGMDVYGRAPEKEWGEYFRSNVWWWRPLWNYTAEIDRFYAEQKNAHQLISEKLFESGHCNDGEGLETEEDCRDLVKRLQWSIDEGLLAEYQKEIDESIKVAKENNAKVEKELDALKKKVAKVTGEKDLAPKDYPEDLNEEWHAIYSKRDSRDSYPFSQEHVEEWIKFLKYCGGFQIN